MSPAPTSEAAILEAARRTLDRHGAAGATAERIADEAGISRVTLHRRGLNRERILELLAAEASREYREAILPALVAEGSAADRLERALGVLCELAENNLSLLVALDAQANAVVFHDEAGEEQLSRSAFTAPLERLIRDGALDGSLRDLDPVEAATVLFNLVGWTYVHLRTGHSWKPDRASRTTLEVALDGLRAG